jgi:hypothetical protein
MPAGIAAAWDYAWNAISTHPFGAFTLLFAFAALVISWLALSASRAQAKAARKQAEEAKLSRELNEQALAAQADALKSQSAQALEMTRFAERSALAAERSATAAQGMALSAQQAQRAVLTVVRLPDAIAQDARKVPAAARTHVFNSGKVPALEVHFHQRMEVCAAFPTELPIPESWSTYQPTNIGAGQEYPIFTEKTSPLMAMADVWEGSKFMCVFGMAKYKDFLGDRTLGWCYAWDVRQQLWYPAGDLNRLT